MDGGSIKTDSQTNLNQQRNPCNSTVVIYALKARACT